MNGWRHRMLLVAFAVCMAVIAIFGVRAFHHRPHRKIDEPIKPWMTVPYVAHSYHVSVPDLLQAVGLPGTRPYDHRPIGRIAHEENRSVEDVTHELEIAISHAREPNGESQPPTRSRSLDNPPEKP